MEKSNSFAYYLNKYLAIHLPGERGLATNSIMSYRDTFSLFLEFLKSEKKLQPERLPMSFLTRELVVEFATWLEDVRECRISSRNQRITAIRAFSKWLSYENPEFLKLSSDLVDLKLKKDAKPMVNYISVDAMQCLLSQPDSSTKDGLRDLTLIALMYDTGARVSEIADLKFDAIRFDAPPTVRLTGKGNKARIVPLLPKTVEYLIAYMSRFGINAQSSRERYVFTSHSGKRFSRSGIKYILDKYVNAAKSSNSCLLPENVSPHTLRHSKAMHLLQSGVHIVYIRDILGHAGLNTTERYAKADTTMKREALSKAEIEMPPPPQLPLSIKKPNKLILGDIEDDMAAWLKNFSM